MYTSIYFYRNVTQFGTTISEGNGVCRNENIQYLHLKVHCITA